MQLSKSRKGEKTLFILADVLWAAFIFTRSLQNGTASAGESGVVTRVVTTVSEKVFHHPVQNFSLAEMLVRKSAHFSEYLLLGVLIALTLHIFGRTFRAALAPGLLLGVLGALTDETIQKFIAGRSSSVLDVWLDAAGFAVGLTVALAVAGVVRRHRRGAPKQEIQTERTE